MSLLHRLRCGEIGRVGFDPSLGSEIQKPRPAVVIRSDGVGRLPVKRVAPITGGSDRFDANLWPIRLEADAASGLAKVSAVDVLLVRGVDTQRFIDCLVRVSATLLEEIVAALARVIEYP